jgi:hypothetical protein
LLSLLVLWLLTTMLLVCCWGCRLEQQGAARYLSCFTAAAVDLGLVPHLLDSDLQVRGSVGTRVLQNEMRLGTHPPVSNDDRMWWEGMPRDTCRLSAEEGVWMGVGRELKGV